MRNHVSYLVTCNKIPHRKTYEVAPSKENPRYTICPACGCYHRLKKEK